MSKMIQVRNVPERLHRELTKRARAHGQTLTDYIQEILERVAGRPKVRLGRPAAELIREERAEQEAS